MIECSPLQAGKPVRIAIIGEIARSTGTGTLPRSEAIAGALAMMDGVSVTLRAVVSDHVTLERVQSTLNEAGVQTDLSIRSSGRIVKGDPLDIREIFGHDVVILDFDDPPLRHFLTDLPAHTRPDVHLLGTLSHARQALPPAERDVALRFDTIAGSMHEFAQLTGIADATTALRHIADRMRGANLRTAVMLDDDHIEVATPDETRLATCAKRLTLPHLTASIAVGVARRLEIDEIVAALCFP